ncbi:LOW QUALITY PROTEIN: peroxisome biosynthesis protein PAS1-like [Pollicipes pollicipes]|uniref:LOW QUALITY PROTEIN: peroxisome biosynthesis protein PAS1-like n=1 Tax=Pollicipes pollicipes TaxID=41117 RepID=UPI0018859DC5|nr:LOW QUALITY PROTEIN: peroxisome biosynthesis protein PAS1-like [Pollicipes pollicipes]
MTELEIVPPDLTCVWPERLSQSALETVRHHLTAWQRCLGDATDIWWRSGALLRLADERTLRPFDVVLEAEAEGVGKTTLARQACRRLAQPPLCAFVSELDCSSLLGKKPEVVGERVGRLLREAELRQPALVVLDALDEVRQSRPDPVPWSQVGGLEDARQLLVDTLQRPLLYPALYARAGRHVQARALLYGPPGSGKTLLARALAHQADSTSLQVKGPELLSKYIGASELAVRDLFERASRASPSLIFFDEFESLAPRRGHDSTGVTDRVVNQLLTLLDGAETPAGGGQVALLAASSRPDLLDPALLRPGRVGRLVRCRMPDRAARADILRALTARLRLAADVRLPALAARDGLSGADLRAAVADAHLRAVAAEGGAPRAWTQAGGPPLDEREARAVDEHPLLATGGDAAAAAAGARPVEVVVTQAHLQAALDTLRPSLSAADLARYDRIYSQFESGRLTDGASAGGDGDGGGGAGARQRVSLA